MTRRFRRFHYAWIRFRRDLQKTVVSRIGTRIDVYHRVP